MALRVKPLPQRRDMPAQLAVRVVVQRLDMCTELLVSAILALLWWNRAVEGLGAPRAGLLLHLIPAFTFVLAIALLGEEPRPFHAVGIVLIGAGIYLTTILKSGKADAG